MANRQGRNVLVVQRKAMKRVVPPILTWHEAAGTEGEKQLAATLDRLFVAALARSNRSPSAALDLVAESGYGKCKMKNETVQKAGNCRGDG